MVSFSLFESMRLKSSGPIGIGASLGLSSFEIEQGFKISRDLFRIQSIQVKLST